MASNSKPVRWYDDYTVFIGEVKGGAIDGMPSISIKLKNRASRKKAVIAIPEEVAIQLAHDILELTDEYEPTDFDEPSF
jgi:hypothetical protein